MSSLNCNKHKCFAEKIFIKSADCLDIRDINSTLQVHLEFLWPEDYIYFLRQDGIAPVYNKQGDSITI